MNRHVQQRAETQSREEGEPEQHGQAGGAVLAIVWRHEDSQGKTQAEERQEDAASTQDVGEHVDVSSSSCRENAHREGGVDILQVTTDARLELVVERINKVVQSRSNGVSHFLLILVKLVKLCKIK